MRFSGSSYTDDQSHWMDVTSADDPVGGIAYKVIACIIFALVSYTFLFPCNLILPLDRRTVAVLGAVLVYCTQTFVFYGHEMTYSLLQVTTT